MVLSQTNVGSNVGTTQPIKQSSSDEKFEAALKASYEKSGRLNEYTPSNGSTITIYKPATKQGNTSYYGADTTSTQMAKQTSQNQSTASSDVVKPQTQETNKPNSNTKYNGESLPTLLTGSNLMTPANPSFRQVTSVNEKGYAGFEDLARKQSFQAKVEDVKKVENTRQALVINQVNELIKKQNESRERFFKQGTVSEYKKDKGFDATSSILGLSSKMEAKQQEASQKNTIQGALQSQALGFGSLGVAVVGGGVSVVEHPIQTAIGLGTFAKDIITVKPQYELGEQLWSKPSETIGTMVGQGLVIGAIGKSLPSPKIRTLEIPSDTTPTIIKGYGLETKGGRALVIATKTPEGVSFGRANIEPFIEKMPIGKEIRISTPIETSIIQKAISSLPEEKVVNPLRAKEFIPTTQALIRGTKYSQPKIEDFPKQTERLSPEETKILLDFVREKGQQTPIVISGSYSRGAQLSKTFDIGGELYNLNKVPRDIDIHFTTAPSSIIGSSASELLLRFQKTGGEFRLVDEGGIVKNTIEKKQSSGEYMKVTEFLGEGTIPVEEGVPDMVVGFIKAEDPITINGIKATPLREELRGVIQGTARFKKTESGQFDIMPPDKRLKDIGSVSVASRSLYQSQFIKRPFLKENIEKFESLYPEELVREQVIKAKLGEIKPETIKGDKLFDKESSSMTLKRIIPVKEVSGASKLSKDYISELPKPSSNSRFTRPSGKSESGISNSVRNLLTSESTTPKPSNTQSPIPSPNKSVFPSTSQSVMRNAYNSISPSKSQINPSIMNSNSGLPQPVRIDKSTLIPFKSFESAKNSLYSIEIGVKGKTKIYEQIGGLNLQQAKSLLKSKLIGGLGASGKIVDASGKNVYMDLGEQFTTSKSEVGRVVQKSKYRLSSGGEKSQIRSFLEQSPFKKKKKSFLF